MYTRKIRNAWKIRKDAQMQTLTHLNKCECKDTLHASLLAECLKESWHELFEHDKTIVKCQSY